MLQRGSRDRGIVSAYERGLGKVAEPYGDYINDGSQDKTRSLLDHIAATDPLVKVIHFSRNFGHQPAVTAGINNCDADLAIIIDADMQDPPELIPDLLEVQEREDANVVYCVRKSREGESLFKLFTSKAFYRVMNYMSEVHFPLDTGDFRLVDRKVMNEFDRFMSVRRVSPARRNIRLVRC